MNKNIILIYAIFILWFVLFESASNADSNMSNLCSEKGYKINVVPLNMTVHEKKLRFQCMVQPVVEQIFDKLTKQYEEVSTLIRKDKNSDQLWELRIIYGVETNSDLLKAIKPHPKSITIAQAALESDWGTSRFFREANNMFGMWSFNKDEPRIAAGKKRGNRTIWIKKYSSLEESVEDYYMLLAQSRSFSEFRNLKMETSDPYLLVKKLDKYSEMKAEYGKKLESMIRYNGFFEED